MVCEEKIKELQIENEHLKKEISELEILHKTEKDELQKRTKEMEESDLVKFEYVDPVKDAFADIIRDLSPIEIAEKLINSKKTVEYGFKIGAYESNVLECQELREISKYLEVYCDFNEME